MTASAGSGSAASETLDRAAPGGKDLLAALWERHRDTNLERVQLIEAAALELLDGDLFEARRNAASTAAHKLAGALGTFGFDDGTRLARAAEALLAQPSPDARELSECVVGLLEIIAPAHAAPDAGEQQGSDTVDGHDAQTGVLLLLSADPDLAISLEVAAAGHELRFAGPSVDSFEHALTDPAIVAVLVDLDLPRGLDLLSTAAAVRFDVPVCALATKDSYAERLRVVEAGGTGFLGRDLY